MLTTARVVFVIMLISSLAFYGMAFRVPAVRIPLPCTIRIEINPQRQNHQPET